MMRAAPGFIPAVPLQLTPRLPVRATRGARRLAATCKYKVELATLGRKSSKDAVYDGAIAEYSRRLTGTMSISERAWKRDAAAASIETARHAGHSVIILDVAGPPPRDSVHFADTVFSALERGRSHLTFVIGDADGFPSDVAEVIRQHRTLHNVHVLSLSTLTLTHKMVRCLLFLFYLHACEVK